MEWAEHQFAVAQQLNGTQVLLGTSPCRSCTRVRAVERAGAVRVPVNTQYQLTVQHGKRCRCRNRCGGGGAAGIFTVNESGGARGIMKSDGVTLAEPGTRPASGDGGDLLHGVGNGDAR